MTVLTACPDPIVLAGRHRMAMTAPAAAASRIAPRIGVVRVALGVAGLLGHTASLLAVLVITGSVIGMINSTPSGDDVTSTLGHSTTATP